MSKSAILAALQAETLLGDSHIFKQIEQLKSSLKYKTDGQFLSFDDFYVSLENQVDGLSKLKLQPTVPKGTENQYLLQLISALENVLDDCDRIGQKVVHYEAKLKDAASQIKKTGAAFGVWYSLGAAEVIANYNVPLPASQIKLLAEAEFSRLMENLDTSVLSLISAVKVTQERLKMHKKTQQDKMKLGQDQANNVWTSQFPAWGDTSPEDPTPVLEKPEPEEDVAEPQEVEEVPAFVSKKPRIISAPIKFDSVSIIPEDQIVDPHTRFNQQPGTGLSASVRVTETIEANQERPGELPPLKAIPLFGKKFYCRATTVPCDLGFATEQERDDHEKVHEAEHAKLNLKAIANDGSVVDAAPRLGDINHPAKQAFLDKTYGTVEENVAKVAEAVASAPVAVDDFAALTGATPAAPSPAPVAPKKDKPQRRHTDPLVYRAAGANEPVIDRESDPAEKIKCVVCDRRIRKGQTMFQRDGGWAHAVDSDCTERDMRDTPRTDSVMTKIADATHTVLRKTEDDAPPATKPLEPPVVVATGDTSKDSFKNFDVDADTLIGQMEAAKAEQKPTLNDLIAQARTHVMTPEEEEAQRRSFVAGNLAIDSNKSIEETRALVDAVADDVVDGINVQIVEEAGVTAAQILAATEPPEVKLTATPRKRITFLEDDEVL